MATGSGQAASESQRSSPLAPSTSSFSSVSPVGTLLSATPSRATGIRQRLITPRTTASRTPTLQHPRLGGSSEPHQESDDVSFSKLDLFCPLNPEDIKTRWIQAYVPVLGQTIKEYPSGVSGFIHRMLKSYASVAVHGRGSLPFIHSRQLMAQPSGSPLTTCLSLARICSTSLPGSKDTAATMMHREMDSLFEQRDKYDEENLFAAFQAYLIYSMILVLLLDQSQNDHFRGTMTNLQELASFSAGQGLLCAAEQRRARPKWEEWIVSEAKRRTLYVMYLLDSVLCIREGLPTILATELSGLPAPGSKLLWQAKTRYEWEKEYNLHLAEWMDGSLTIDELWPAPADLDATALATRQMRVDHWLEHLDEYGVMLYAVTRCTHGE